MSGGPGLGSPGPELGSPGPELVSGRRRGRSGAPCGVQAQVCQHTGVSPSPARTALLRGPGQVTSPVMPSRAEPRGEHRPSCRPGSPARQGPRVRTPNPRPDDRVPVPPVQPDVAGGADPPLAESGLRAAAAPRPPAVLDSCSPVLGPNCLRMFQPELCSASQPRHTGSSRPNPGSHRPHPGQGAGRDTAPPCPLVA